MKLKQIVSETPQRVLSFVTSPKFAAALGIGVAIFQFASAVDQYIGSSKGKKQIGFSNNDNDNIMSRFLRREQ